MKNVKRTQTKRKVVAENTHVWMGIDVHKTNATVTVLDSDVLQYCVTLPMEEVHFDALVARFPGCVIEAVYEAGYTGYALLEWLRTRGVIASMVAPSMVPKRPGEYVKNDRRDSLKLAVALRGGMLDAIQDLTPQQYEDRQLLRLRQQLVQERTQVCQRIKAILCFHNVDCPNKTVWSQKFLTWLESLPSERPGIDFSLSVWVRVYRNLSDEIAKVEAQISELAATERYAAEVDLLDTIPGVGLITAMTVLTEVGNMDRFSSAEQMVGYLGLAPGERTSDGKGVRGGLPRKGNAHIRNVLIQAAWKTIKKHERLRAVYERIKARNAKHGAQIAIVAVARRLALAMRAMLRDGTVYELGESTEEQAA